MTFVCPKRNQFYFSYSTNMMQSLKFMSLVFSVLISTTFNEAKNTGDFLKKVVIKYIYKKIHTYLLFKGASVFGEECGDGFMCIFDQKIIAYGCAPNTNLTNTVCCSTGQGCENPGQECGKWCGKKIPYCPANGATGEGCVRK